MTDDKTRVKSLAIALSMPVSDFLQKLHDLGIQVNNSKSILQPEDLVKIKAHFPALQSEKKAEESQSGIIVRRKRRQQQAENPEASTAQKPSEEKKEDKAKAENPQKTETASKTDDSGKGEGGNQKNRQGSQRSGRERAKNTSGNDQERQEQRQARPNRNRRKRPMLRDSAALVAKVISRPGDPVPTPPASSAPALAAQIVAPSAVQPVAQATKTPSAPQATPSAQVAPEKSEKKAQESSQTKPQTASIPTPAPVSANLAKATAKVVEKPTEKPRKIQPAASASPEGSSTPTLLPPVAEPRPEKATGAESPEKEKTEERRPRHERRRRNEQTAPQVKIISRPDPNATPVRPSREVPSASDSRNERGGYDGYKQRSGGYKNQEDRDSREGREGREGQGRYKQNKSSNGGFPPAGFPLESEREGQSKKKRNKQRRTVDFQNETNFSGRRQQQQQHDDDDEMPRMTRSPRRRPKNRPAPQPVTQPIKAAKRKIRVEEAIRVADMAHQMGLKASEIIKVLFNLGIMATINKSLDVDTATVVASEFGYEVEKVGFAEEDYITTQTTDAPESLQLRPPVVTIMGHVDHGKTSLLDAIRKTNVTSGEAGGITQHIGAYHVKTRRGEIVFLDTPGHEAFTAMRARGAQVTDIVVLVVAADDGVMEQTREAVNHARAAHVPIMVAVNKIDKPEANPDRVLRELADLGLVPVDWGGDTEVSKVSAKTRQGLDDFLELLALQADILELKANPNKPARGHIVEARLDKGRGPVATVLIQEGTLHPGDDFVCGVFSGRVRAMFNDQGRKVKEAGPSIPVEVQGFEGVPEAGEEFICLTDEKLTRRIAASRAVKQRERELAKESRVTLETFLANTSDDEAKILNLVVKADVQGSLEAILEAMKKLNTDKVHINIIHGGAGAITESDVLLASASDAIIIGFNVRPTAKVKEVAEHENVDIRFYDIIYKLVDEIKSAMAGLLAPVSKEVYLGQAEVRETFNVPKFGVIAGSQVVDGKITRTAGARILRDGVVVHTGKIASLRRFKDDVKEVLKGYECGIGLENFNDIKVGDVLEAFETIEEAATL